MSMTPEEIELCAAQRGLSIAALCRLAKISPSTFWRWRALSKKLSLERYDRLVAALESVPPL
jgi:hypothetical protein